MPDKGSNVIEAQEAFVTGLDEIEATENVEYKIIDGFKDGQKLRIGSLSAGDFIEWSESVQDKAAPQKKRFAGLRLIAKSLVGPEPTNRRYAAEQIDMSVQIFSRKPHRVTENIVREILKLNGIRTGKDESPVDDAKKD